MLLNSIFIDKYPFVLGSVKKQPLSKSKQLKITQDGYRQVRFQGNYEKQLVSMMGKEIPLYSGFFFSFEGRKMIEKETFKTIEK